jgi:hypothetical protein
VRGASRSPNCFPTSAFHPAFRLSARRHILKQFLRCALPRCACSLFSLQRVRCSGLGSWYSPHVRGDSDEQDWSAFSSPYRHAAGGFSSPAQQLPPTGGQASMIDVHWKTRADIDDGDDRRFEVADALEANSPRRIEWSEYHDRTPKLLQASGEGSGVVRFVQCASAFIKPLPRRRRQSEHRLQ